MANQLQQAFRLHAEIYRAIAHPKRLEVINLLRDRELSVKEMSQMLGIRQANLSQHLGILRQAKIVSTRQQGVRVYYRLVSPNLVKAQDLVREVLLNQIAARGDKNLVALDLGNALEIKIDPVCRMKITKISASDHLTHQDKTYYFCGRGCKRKFLNQPKKYLSRA